MIDDPILLHDWHVVARANELGDEPKAVRLLDRELVLWRSDGGLHAWHDLCLHRGARLSGGRVTSNWQRDSLSLRTSDRRASFMSDGLKQFFS